jgi:hypothetical protein
MVIRYNFCVVLINNNMNFIALDYIALDLFKNKNTNTILHIMKKNTKVFSNTTIMLGISTKKRNLWNMYRMKRNVFHWYQILISNEHPWKVGPPFTDNIGIMQKSCQDCTLD